ncbi:MAG: peroxiredoxin [Bacteroidia bacterium]|nr:peroxiredoxin [Bacteroidia bacterium]
MARLHPGEQAPEFELFNQDKKPVSLQAYAGVKSVILFFYPKDESPESKRLACGFRDAYEAFQEAQAEVIGISPDSDASHKLFSISRHLHFQLLSDPKNKIAKQYGLRESWLIQWAGYETFIIDTQGIIRHIIPWYGQPDTHAAEVLHLLRKMNAEPPAHK